MIYVVLITRRAQRELSVLPAEVYQRLKAAIGNLATNPRPAGCIKLHGVDGWRIREGIHRVLYLIDDAHRVTVMHVGHRRDLYG